MDMKLARCVALLMGGIAISWGVTGTAQAKAGQPYIALSLGTGTAYTTKDPDGTKYKYNNPVEVSAALGYGVTKHVRAEVEMLYENKKLDSAKLGSVYSTSNGGIKTTQLSLMANGYYDFKTRWKIVPYLGAGIGVSEFRGNSGTVNFSDGSYTVFSSGHTTGLAVQFKAGVGYRVTQNTILNVGYRYFDFIKKGYPHTFRNNSSLEVGLRYGF